MIRKYLGYPLDKADDPIEPKRFRQSSGRTMTEAMVAMLNRLRRPPMVGEVLHVIMFPASIERHPNGMPLVWHRFELVRAEGETNLRIRET